MDKVGIRQFKRGNFVHGDIDCLQFGNRIAVTRRGEESKALPDQRAP